jgi:hypothetical protein
MHPVPQPCVIPLKLTRPRIPHSLQMTALTRPNCVRPPLAATKPDTHTSGPIHFQTQLRSGDQSRFRHRRTLTLWVTTDHKRNGCHNASRSPADPAHLAPQGHPNLASRSLARTDPSLLSGPTALGPTPPGVHQLPYPSPLPLLPHVPRHVHRQAAFLRRATALRASARLHYGHTCPQRSRARRGLTRVWWCAGGRRTRMVQGSPAPH